MRATRFRGLISGALLSLGCGTDPRVGLDEPILVHDAQFVVGELPSGEGPASEPGTFRPSFLWQRLSGVEFSGLAFGDAAAIGVRLEDEGTGYWLVPTGTRNDLTASALNWSFSLDLQDSLDPGVHRLLLTAFDENGNAGPTTVNDLCINPFVPDNGNACNPRSSPPYVVLSLEWDTPVDLDLRVVLPDDQVIDANRPISGEPDASGNYDLNAPGVGKLQRDANARCVIDGRQREDVVFQARPPRGTYRVYANLTRACGENRVTYKASYHARVSTDEGFDQNTAEIGAGALVPEQAGSGLGTFVGELTVN